MKPLIVAIHGILTSQTAPSWPDAFDAWMYRRDPEVKVLKKEYRAGPFPRWNCWVKDPLLARGLANEIELFLAPSSHTLPPVWFVAHSNGAVIALMATKRLMARGCWTGGLILTGAACEADLEKNGVWEWWRTGALDAAIAYSSADDQVLNGDPREHREGNREIHADGEIQRPVPPHPGPLPWGEGEPETGSRTNERVESVEPWPLAHPLPEGPRTAERFPTLGHPSCGGVGNALGRGEGEGTTRQTLAHDLRSRLLSYGFSRLRSWLWGKLMWPYGCLGRTGWLLHGQPLSSSINRPGPIPCSTLEVGSSKFEVQVPILTRWYPGGHSTYFTPENRERTFEQIYQDITSFNPQPHSSS
jgi:hypothetical protein